MTVSVTTYVPATVYVLVVVAELVVTVGLPSPKFQAYCVIVASSRCATAVTVVRAELPARRLEPATGPR